MSVQRCENCRYWRRDGFGDFRADFGFCRRYPPEWRGGTASGYPPTREHDWCGEHQPKYDIRREGEPQ